MFVFLFSMKLTTTRYLLVEIEDDVVGDLAGRTGILGRFWNISLDKVKYILYLQSECLNNVSILGGFTTKHGYFCHPNTKMAAKNLNEAQLECLNDQSCDMFYRVCDYPDSRFRKCTNTAEAVYQDPSTCGDILGQSSLYIRGNTFGIWYFYVSIYKID